MPRPRTRTSRRCWSGVLVEPAPRSISATRPSSASMPVAVTSRVPRPTATLVPEYAIELRPASSASGGTGSDCLSDGTDSPVSADSSMRRTCASTMRPSAGTIEPASRRTRSPGTSSLTGTSRGRPSLRTEALGVAIACNEAMARSARYSWRNPIQAFSATTTRITTASVTSPSVAERTPAPISIRIIGEVSWSSRILPGRGSSPRSISLGPWLSSTAAARASLRPRSGSLPSWSAITPTGAACSGGPPARSTDPEYVRVGVRFPPRRPGEHARVRRITATTG